MLEELERKRIELMQELNAVGAAIKAYAKTIGQHHKGAVKKGATKRKKRHMSAATKKKLSLATKARWAKINAKKG